MKNCKNMLAMCLIDWLICLIIFSVSENELQINYRYHRFSTAIVKINGRNYRYHPFSSIVIRSAHIINLHIYQNILERKKFEAAVTYAKTKS